MKYAAIALQVGPLFGSNCPVFLLDNDNELKLFDSEKQALRFIDKYYSPSTVLIGMIDDPTLIYMKLKAKINEQRKKEKSKQPDKKTTKPAKKTVKVLKNPKKSNKKNEQRVSRDNDRIVSP